MTDYESCQHCKFWKRGFRDHEPPYTWFKQVQGRAELNPFGQCRNTPNYVERHQDDWCPLRTMIDLTKPASD